MTNLYLPLVGRYLSVSDLSMPTTGQNAYFSFQVKTLAHLHEAMKA